MNKILEKYGEVILLMACIFLVTFGLLELGYSLIVMIGMGFMLGLLCEKSGTMK
tara:strand:- start:731 stop:892 length:162 start_codon:yes stop_codon:yes gene_type:complete